MDEIVFYININAYLLCEGVLRETPPKHASKKIPTSERRGNRQTHMAWFSERRELCMAPMTGCVHEYGQVHSPLNA